MIAFISPLWLCAAGVVAIAGIWMLWAGQTRTAPVSSLRLWRSPDQSAPPARARRIDPLWILVLLSALLAALALARPVWRHAAAIREPAPTFDCIVREARGGDRTRIEAWVKLRANSPAQPRGEWLLKVDGQTTRLSADNLRSGISIPLDTQPAVSQYTLHLESPGGQPGFESTFTRPVAGLPFGLIRVTTPQTPVGEALWRVFSIMPGAQPADPNVLPRVVLVNHPQLSPAEAAQLAGDGGLLIALADTPLPGLLPGDARKAPAEGWPVQITAAPASLFAWPAFVKMDDVRIHVSRPPMLEAPWQVLAKVNGEPWIAIRRSPIPPASATRPAETPATWLWIGSDLDRETDWWKQPSFVLFFSALVEQPFNEPSHNARITEWQEKPTPPLATLIPTPDIPLTPYIAATIIALLLVAAIWQFRRLVN